MSALTPSSPKIQSCHHISRARGTSSSRKQAFTTSYGASDAGLTTSLHASRRYGAAQICWENLCQPCAISSTTARHHREDTSAAASPSGYPDSLPNAPSDHGGDVFPVMSAAHTGQHPPLFAEQGPCLVAGVVTMNDSSFTTKIKIHSGPVGVQLDCVALLGTGSPQTFINTHALESIKRAGAASAICERHTPPRSWGGGRQVPACPGLRCSTLKRSVLPRRPPNRITHRMGIRRPSRSHATRRESRTRQLDAIQ